MSVYLQQFRGIIVSNIIFSHRNHYFWKHFLLQIVFLVLLIIKGTDQSLSSLNIYTLNLLENVLAIIVNCQFLVLEYLDNRQRFLIFQKANGINIYVYIGTWIFYCLCVGLLQVLFYCGLYSTFLNYYTEHTTTNNQSSNIAILCNSIILTYFSTFAYIFFFGILIPTKQVGVKIITALLITSYLTFERISSGANSYVLKWVRSTPIGLYFVTTFKIIG
jgi:hypothetical protein